MGRNRSVAERMRLFFGYLMAQFTTAPEELMKRAEDRAANTPPDDERPTTSAS